MAIALARDRHLARDARREPDLAAPAGRLRGVARDVEHRLDELLLVAGEIGQARVVVAAHDEPLGEFGREERAHALGHLVHIERLDARQPARREEAIHQRLQAVGLLHDHLREFAQLRCIELALEQLRRAADAAERILDLVREVADELAVGLLLLEHLRLARDLELLLDLAEFHHQPRFTRFDRADHAKQVHALAADVELQIVLAEARIRIDRLAQALHEGRVAGKQLRELRADEMLAPMDEERLGGWIGIGHAKALVEHEHGGR